MTPLAQRQAHRPAVSELLDDASARPAAERADWLARLWGVGAEHREALLATAAGVETDDSPTELPRLSSAAIHEADLR